MFDIAPEQWRAMMVELTYGGTWLKWSSLQPRDRNWALLSFATATLAAIPIALPAYDLGYRYGYRLASGGREVPSSPFAALLNSELYGCAMLAAVVLAVVSAIAWWRFSVHQDEMFNRIQNHAAAQAGCWTFAIVFIWWMLSLGGWVGPLPLGAIVAIGVVLLLGFWFYAVRRWL